MAGEPVTLESYFETLDNGETIRIKGHRVGLDLILDEYHAGLSPEQIAEQFDSIRLEDVYAAITYYLHNKDRLDAWLADLHAWVQQDIAEHQAHPSPVAERLRKLSRALQAEPARRDDNTHPEGQATA